ncbi:sulfotransferase [Aphanothece sacrum]|uniref:sulfotransferase n=1 Tax=Aphanothece sacrum TaxID=1122 RepID=UPI001D1317DF|nr:sulfotransferase [Aphanothece sacrum]
MAVCSVLIGAMLLTPFPHWPTYLRIWHHVLFDPEPSISFKDRQKQVFYLLNYAFKLPFIALCWCLDDLLFPQYRLQTIRTPVFIVAQPRSATTFLHRTLASDEKTFFGIRLLEWRYPSILLQKILQSTGFLERMSLVNYWGNNHQADLTEKMHYSYLNDYEDDGFLFEECFFHQFYVINRFPYPKLLEDIDNFAKLSRKTQERMLQTQYKVIQKVLYLRGRNLIYVSKDNECLQRVNIMKSLYPDALFVTITRPSEKFMNSYLTLICQSAYCKSGVDVTLIPNWEPMQRTVRVEAAHQTIEFFDSLSPEQKLGFSFDRLTQNIKDSVELVYRQLGLSLTPDQAEYLKNLDTQQNLRDAGYKTSSQEFQEFEFFDRFAAEVDKNHEALLKSINLIK